MKVDKMRRFGYRQATDAVAAKEERLRHFPDKSCSFDCRSNALRHPSPFSIKPLYPLIKQGRAGGARGGGWGRRAGERGHNKAHEAFAGEH